MKLFFLKDDSLYKIFKTLEKVQANRSVTIHIHSENPIYTNDRRGKQLLEVIRSKNIDATLITTNEHMRAYAQRIGIPYEHEEQHKFLKMLELGYLFLFNIKKFHLHLYSRKNYAFYLIFGFEVLVISIIFYIVYLLIIPSATISITPTFSVEDVVYNFRYYPAQDTSFARDSRQLTIPYYSGNLNYTLDMSIQSDNVTYTQKPASGEVTIYNTTNQPYTLVGNTKWMTDDGMLFSAPDQIFIPAGSTKNPSKTLVHFVASDADNSNIIMGSRWNIAAKTQLVIRNLSLSANQKQIFAVANNNFQGGETDRYGTVTSGDQQHLRDKLIENLNDNKVSIVRDNFTTPGQILLGYQNMVTVTPLTITVHTPVWSQSIMLSGTITAAIHYNSILRDDMHNSIDTYLNQRAGNTRKLMNIEENSLVFYDPLPQEDATIIPTKMSVVRGYDFTTDTNQILPDIFNKIASDTPQDAESLILSYPEIANAKITITPPRYHEIPKLKSRIKIQITWN